MIQAKGSSAQSHLIAACAMKLRNNDACIVHYSVTSRTKYDNAEWMTIGTGNNTLLYTDMNNALHGYK